MKKFLPVFVLLLVALGLCVIGDAASVPPWWMIGQSATENGTASFTVPVTTTAIDSGPATFTGAINSDAAVAQVRHTKSDGLVSMLSSRRYGYVTGNVYHDGSNYVKEVVASASALLFVDGTGKNTVFYYSDAGSSDPYQYGPFTFWHSGMSSYTSSSPVLFGANTTDGSDTGYAVLSCAPTAGSARGGSVWCYGNEHASLAGVVDVFAGNAASGSVRLITQGTERVVVNASGETDLFALAGSGNRAVYSDPSGTLTNSSSDSRMKKNVVQLTDALARVLQLRGVSFNWDTSVPEASGLGEQSELGFVAQEVLPIVPEVVGVNANGMYSLDYAKFIPLLVEAAKDQKTLLDQTIAAQQAQIQALEARIAALEAK